MTTLTLQDIRAAAARIDGHVDKTPCRHSRTLSEITGADVWVKFENLQFTAAYKERGALNKLLQLTRRRAPARRHRRLGRQPRPGPGLSRPAPGHAGDHRHAARHAAS